MGGACPAILPNSKKALLIHHHGPILTCNHAMGDLVGARPEKVRGQVGIWRRICEPASSALIDRWTDSRDPASYEVQTKTGQAVLISSRATKYKGQSCRVVSAERLKKWI